MHVLIATKNWQTLIINFQDVLTAKFSKWWRTVHVSQSFAVNLLFDTNDEADKIVLKSCTPIVSKLLGLLGEVDLKKTEVLLECGKRMNVHVHYEGHTHCIKIN